MQLDHLIAFNIALLAALLSPGPGMLVTIRNTLANGRRAGIATGFGLGTVAACWTGAALLGLDAIFAIFPWAHLTLRITGALYLLYIAYAVWKDAHTPIAPAPHSDRKSFVTGVLVNLSNPKSILFAAAVIVVIFPAGINYGHMALIVANQMVLEWTFYVILALTLSHHSIRQRYLSIKPILDRIAASMLGALGLKLLTDR